MDRLNNNPDFEPNVFKYVGVPEKHEKYIDVNIVLGGAMHDAGAPDLSGAPANRIRKARLPLKLIRKRMVIIFKKDKQVQMPAFLARNEKLIE
jgi:hypothetical protein